MDDASAHVLRLDRLGMYRMVPCCAYEEFKRKEEEEKKTRADKQMLYRCIMRNTVMACVQCGCDFKPGAFWPNVLATACDGRRAKCLRCAPHQGTQPHTCDDTLKSVHDLMLVFERMHKSPDGPPRFRDMMRTIHCK